MLFNSIDFAIFIPIVFLLYWFVTNHSITLQNALIVAASYLFYGWWDWRFLGLILLSTVIDYSVGFKLSTVDNQRNRKILLWTSIILNLGILGFFKYYNFFLDNFITVFSFFGTEIKANSLHLILPIGISFYTFQTMSYSIDVYRRKLEPTKDFIAFSAFVSFFPQLVAGPIERASNLLPQFYKKRHFDYTNAVDGTRQILWGLFKKVVIADNCAIYANEIFNNSGEYSGASLFIGALFFTIQVYGDFSGYSDIAIGTSRLFGFNLKQNFAFPFFSRDIAELWRRWHISLTSWFKDYVYIPLGGSSGGTWRRIRNTFIVFLVSGFWHGADWTYIAWAGINAIYFLPILISKNNLKHIEIVAKDRKLPNLKELFLMLKTFGFFVMSLIMFRCRNMWHALDYYHDLLFGLFDDEAYVQSFNLIYEIGLPLLASLLLFIVGEWVGRREQFALAQLGINWPSPIRVSFYYLIFFAILWLGGEKQQYIYFQF